jgi:hypothetical protein
MEIGGSRSGALACTRVAADMDADIDVELDSEMAPTDLWKRGRSVKDLGDADMQEFEAIERLKVSNCRAFGVVLKWKPRTKRPSRKLGVEPDHSLYEDAPRVNFAPSVLFA